MNIAAVVIQRSFLAWSRLRNLSATKIQKTIRKRIAVKDVRVLIVLYAKVKAATKIQNFQRCQKQSRQFIVLKYAVVKIQTLWRKVLARMAFEDMKAERAITKIQSFQRCQKQRFIYICKKRSVIRIQNLWRAVLARNAFMRRKAAAVKIQVEYREYQARKELQNIFVSRVVRVQSLVERLLDERRAMIRDHEARHKVKISSNQFSFGSRVTRNQIKLESMANGLYLKKLAARVDSTVNEAKALSNDDIRDFVHRGHLATPNGLRSKLMATRSHSRDFVHKSSPVVQSGPCLERLAARVHSTLDEADTFSNEDIRDFVHRVPLVASLPSTSQKPISTSPMNLKSKGVGAPFRVYKESLISDTSKATSKYVNPKALLSITNTSVPNSKHKQLKATKIKAPSAVATRVNGRDRENSDVNLLAKQAKELMREGRAAMRKNRNDTSKRDNFVVAMPAQRSSEIRAFAKGKSSKKRRKKPVDNKTSLKNFGGAIMPSPIRPQEGKPDWDWTSEW
jgi:hypothetical protein